MAADSNINEKNDISSLTIKAGGSEIDGSWQVKSVEVVKEVNKIPYAWIRIFDGSAAGSDFTISEDNAFKPGSEVEIEAGYHSTNETIFKGIVIKHAIRVTGSDSSYIEIECRDKAVKMTAGRKNAYYPEKKDSEIIEALIGNSSGLSKDVEATSTKHEQIVQYYCSDWDFMLMRAEINGLITVVDDGKVSVKKPVVSGTAPVEITFGASLIDLHAEIDAAPTLKAVKAYNYKLDDLSVTTSSASTPSLNSQSNLKASDLSGVLGLANDTLQTPAPIPDAAAKSWADAWMLKSQMARIRGKVRFEGTEKVKHGGLLSIAGVGDRVNGTGYVAAVRHIIDSGQWTTEASLGYPADWFSERSPQVEAPGASGLVAGVRGLHTAKVKQIDEDKEGQFRILVTLPMMGDDAKGVWARLANTMATKEKGFFWYPEIGDEVVVGFINDDPCYPVIMGMLYSKSVKPPYTPEKKNNTKAIVTREKMVIEFDEEKKIITIKTPGGQIMTLDDDKEQITLDDSNKNSYKMDKDGFTIDSCKDITMTAKGDIKMSATNIQGDAKTDIKWSATNISAKGSASYKVQAAQVEIKADGTAVFKSGGTGEVSATGPLSVKSTATTTVEGAAQCAVKGAIVMIN